MLEESKEDLELQQQSEQNYFSEIGKMTSMDQLQGTIEVKSTQNLGTHFLLKFPMMQQIQA